MTDILGMPIHLQVALAGGYMGYITAYSGLRSGHTARDALLLILVFGVFSAIAYPVLILNFAQFGDGRLALLQGVAAVLALICPVIAGALWRWRVRSWWYDLLHKLGVHVDDGLGTAWESLIQHPKTNVTQVMVRMTNGTELFCEDALRHAGSKSSWTGLAEFSPKLGSDGSVIMPVDTEEASIGGETARTSLLDNEWGCRLTYIPASQIDCIELRVRDANRA